MQNELLEDDGEHEVVEIFRSISIKKVIYMIVESWDQVAENGLWHFGATQGLIYRYEDSGQKYFWGPPQPKPRVVIGWLIGV